MVTFIFLFLLFCQRVQTVRNGRWSLWVVSSSLSLSSYASSSFSGGTYCVVCSTVVLLQLLKVFLGFEITYRRNFNNFLETCFFRWFKFTLKPPYSIAHDKLRLAIWDTSFWTFWLKFGHKGP